MSRRKNRSGFTLLEVLLALALFAISIVVLAAAYINILQGLDAVKTDRALGQELRWIRSQILQQPDVELVRKGAEFEHPELGKLRWRAIVEPSKTTADFFYVQMEVEYPSRKQDAKPELHEESFAVLRPTWSEPIERDGLRAEAKKRIEENRRQQDAAKK